MGEAAKEEIPVEMIMWLVVVGFLIYMAATYFRDYL